MCRMLAIVAATFAVASCSLSEKGPDLSTELEALQATNPDVPGFALTVRRAGAVTSAATGVAEPDGRPMTAGTPVRMASITKTFVAASVLRLSEANHVSLDTPIRGLIDPVWNDLLASDGYDTGAITVRHLLMHAGGLPDHVGDAYIEAVFSNPDKTWTAEEQIRFLVETTEPLSAPGEAFSYSDSGYILLGHIIVRLTGQGLDKAVRELMKFDELGMETTYWDELETPPEGLPVKAHQWLDGADTFDLNGTLDAYGGGGIVASTEDIALFYEALFGGEVFEKDETLRKMTIATSHPEDSPYRLGLFVYNIGGRPAYGHSGFWGTYVVHVPSTRVTVAGVALDASGFDSLRLLANELAEQ